MRIQPTSVRFEINLGEQLCSWQSVFITANLRMQSLLSLVDFSRSSASITRASCPYMDQFQPDVSIKVLQSICLKLLTISDQ